LIPASSAPREKGAPKLFQGRSNGSHVRARFIHCISLCRAEACCSCHALKLPLKHSGGSGARHRKKSLRCEFMSTAHIPHLHASHHTNLICMHHTHTPQAFACVTPHIPHVHASHHTYLICMHHTEGQLDVCMRPLACVNAHASSRKSVFHLCSRAKAARNTTSLAIMLSQLAYIHTYAYLHMVVRVLPHSNFKLYY